MSGISLGLSRAPYFQEGRLVHANLQEKRRTSRHLEIPEHASSTHPAFHGEGKPVRHPSSPRVEAECGKLGEEQQMTSCSRTAVNLESAAASCMLGND